MRNLHPYTKFSLVFVISGLAVLLDKPLSLAVLAGLATFVFLASRPSKTWLKGYFIIVATTVWGIMLSQGLFYQGFPRTILFCLIPPGKSFSGLCFIREGFLYGLVQSLRMVAGLSAGAYLVNSTSTEMLFRTVSALPFPRGLSLLAAAAVRFLPRVASDLRLLHQSLGLRGYRPFKRGLLYTLRTELAVVYPLLSRAIRDSRSVADTLLTRGFNPLSSGKYRFLPVWPWHEKLATILIFVLLFGIFLVKIVFWAYLQGVYYEESLRPLYALVRNYL
ncbi:hypothetical protein TH606_05245 [Thermodesulfatator autotrophicus]|uniref:Energy-coupling factor transporter transmembrane protein EcfT n=1 Tax=Thermodesulfatator autotrophicus TaxID=1795632 RepID=A0A177E8D8_9BACT|nr:hypothetical protein TH606_05245 [Thermodesulfatator autotrophicus]